MGCGACKQSQPPHSYKREQYTKKRKQSKSFDKDATGSWVQGVGAAEGVEDWSLNPIIKAPGLFGLDRGGSHCDASGQGDSYVYQRCDRKHPTLCGLNHRPNFL
eukprot:Skav214484  [mRNA]  locus=scaffold1011:25506:28282:- [translate_table: standard]